MFLRSAERTDSNMPFAPTLPDVNGKEVHPERGYSGRDDLANETPRAIQQGPPRHGWRRWTFLALGIVVALCAVLAWDLFERKPSAKPKPQPVSVSVATVSVRDVPVSITYLGAAQAWTSDIILSRVSGILLSVDFAEGSNVKAGQLLALVDPAPYQAALTQAQGALQRDKALLAGARVDVARYDTLVQQNSIAKQTYEDQIALVKEDE
jgi:multidrug efflux system membrane fusion protein